MDGLKIAIIAGIISVMCGITSLGMQAYRIAERGGAKKAAAVIMHAYPETDKQCVFTGESPYVVCVAPRRTK